jgi:hypothetical protein
MKMIPKQARQAVSLKQISYGKWPLFIVLFSLFICLPLPAQTADEIATLLQNQAVSYQQASSLVLEAANVKTPPQREAAFRHAALNRWVPPKASPSDTIRLNQASLLIMRAFDIKGGLLYSIFKSPHYAYRELVYKDIIQGRSDPRMKVSGELLLFLVNRILYLTDDHPWAWEKEPAVAPEETHAEETLVETQLEDQQ